MKKIFDYPEQGWPADSYSRVVKLAPEIHKQATEIGIEARLLGASNSWDKAIQSIGFNITFRETDYGCHLWVYIFDDNDNALKFLLLWKQLVDQGRVWGGPYKKPLAVEAPPEHTEQKKPLPKTRSDLTYVAHQTVSEEAKSIILNAFRAKPKRPSAEQFIKYQISKLIDLTRDLYSKAYLMAVFDIEKESRKWDGPTEELIVEDFIGPARLRQWDREDKK